MLEISIKLYQPNHKNEWDSFITNSNQPTFLFQRDFMDYHSNRFQDFSLMIYKNERLIAILPANRDGKNMYSHQGLTYGGLLFNKGFNHSKIQNVLDDVKGVLNIHGIANLFIKGLPIFYNPKHSDSEKQLLLDNNAKIYRTDKVLAIDYNKPFTMHKTKLKNYRKNSKKGFVIEQTSDFSLFWNMVLIPRLKDKHNVSPVHNLDEIELLRSRFPNSIKQYNIYLNNKILAGITIFDKGKVVKSQYGATTKEGEKERALEYLFLHLIYRYKDEGKSFFSMGTVTDDNELGYNKGLLKQKEELGCSVYSQDFYSLEV